MNQLTDFKNLVVDNIIFSETFSGKYSKYIPIGYSNSENEDDDICQLILNTPPNLYTNGIREMLDRSKSDVVGYNMMINMWNRRGPTEDEKLFTDKLEEILQCIKNFLMSIKDELQIEESLIEKMNILTIYGDDQNPRLFCKLMINNRSKKILSSFYNEETNTIMDPLQLLQQPQNGTEKKKNQTGGLVTSALKLENINITPHRISVEIRVIECLYNKIKQQKDRTSLLKPEVSFTHPVVKKEKKRKEVMNPYTTTNTFAALEVEELIPHESDSAVETGTALVESKS